MYAHVLVNTILSIVNIVSGLVVNVGGLLAVNHTDGLECTATPHNLNQNPYALPIVLKLGSLYVLVGSILAGMVSCLLSRYLV